MIVEWTTRAEQALDEITARIIEDFGWDASYRFLYRVRHTTELLERNPRLGPHEPLLADRQKTFRSIVVGRLNKIVYRIDEERIFIVDVWDTRREPRKQAGAIG